jgi:hypothetical protein
MTGINRVDSGSGGKPLFTDEYGAFSPFDRLALADFARCIKISIIIRKRP